MIYIGYGILALVGLLCFWAWYSGKSAKSSDESKMECHPVEFKDIEDWGISDKMRYGDEYWTHQRDELMRRISIDPKPVEFYGPSIFELIDPKPTASPGSRKRDSHGRFSK